MAADGLDHITQRSWLEDPNGQLSWPQVVEQPMQAFEGVLSKGFGKGVIWLKLRIDPQAQPRHSRDADRLILRIRPVYLDNISVYDPLIPGGMTGITGDQVHPRQQELEGLDFMLPIARGQSPRDIWLRLESTSTRQIAVQALNYEDLRRLSQTQELVYALYIGAIFIFMVWGLVYWMFSREPVIGAFGWKQAAALLYALSSLGYTRVYWPASWPASWLDLASSVFGCVAVSAAIYFHVLLIRDFSPPVWVRRMHAAMLALLPIKLVLLVPALQTTIMAVRINMLEVLVSPLLFWVSVLAAKGWSTHSTHKPLLAKWVVVSFYSALVFVLLLAALPGLGLTAGGEIPLYVVQSHGLFTAFLILLMLQYRAHVQQKQQSETALKLERTQLQAQRERDIRQEQEKLLAMLAHELKTPLATMQMRLDAKAPGNQGIRQAIRDMNSVIERCVQTTQLDDRQLQASQTPLDLASLVSEAIASCSHPQRIRFERPDRLMVSSDRQLLLIVLNNLLENACKYAAPDSPIEVALGHAQGESTTGGHAQLVISNLPGPAGWPEASQVFDKYYRSPHARRQAGTGLGLYLVRSVMLVLGGSIDYSPDAQRVRFVLTLPLQPALS